MARRRMAMGKGRARPQKIEWCNNRLELQSDSNVALIDELDKLLVLLQIPPEYEASLTGGSFDEGNMVKNIEACDWLTIAIKNLEASNIDPIYVKLRAVREKRAEFVLLKCTFVRRASEFLRNYFPSLIDSMLNDKGNFSQDLLDHTPKHLQRGHLQRPDHADMRYKCRTYARLLLHIKFVDDACYQIEKYERNVTIMFVILEKIAQVEPKYVDIVLLENYAAFQHSLYDLANVVPTLAKYYHQASEAYEQACSRHINLVIYIHFEKLFQFARRIEELMYNMSPEELDKTINAMYRKLQKNMTAEELLPSLWEKCKGNISLIFLLDVLQKEFLDKYATFLKLISKIYPDEKVTSVNEMRDILAAL
ncbi:hypothetical protein HU200_033520 [Digitaria exilis]|uniref:Exocyst complex component Sec3 C-terminal domain-containing protein n=1 Tax=Digitaria exilis TaxID=1010633 RepID=A0A835EPI5_9POAL|nr:hypothetical protein HU200_033520 [Digitaria exilis]